MAERTGNLRVASVHPLLSPAILVDEIPLTDASADVVARARVDVARILSGQDDRLLVVVGPCSIHDPEAALEYGQKLAPLARSLEKELCLVMRVYFEKPRTTVGWKGLINDPKLDGSFQINFGLREARRILRDLAQMGLPSGTEFLDPITPQFIADLVSWAAIGARTTESQVHRELASGLSMPVGFKNGTRGTVQIAIDAVLSASHPHRFLGVTEQGLAAIVATAGNGDCHVILRGGATGPNYAREHIDETAALLKKAGLRPAVMVDASHGNSRKDPKRQAEVISDLAQQMTAGQHFLVGVMMESFLVGGRQELEDPKKLAYGQSITDACISLEETLPLLEKLADAVRARRKTPRPSWGPPAEKA